MSITSSMLALFVLPVIPFPAIDPIMFEIGPIALRWYGLSYVVGILLGWRFALRLSRRPAAVLDQRRLDDFVVWAAIGTVLGGRLAERQRAGRFRGKIPDARADQDAAGVRGQRQPLDRSFAGGRMRRGEHRAS